MNLTSTLTSVPVSRVAARVGPAGPRHAPAARARTVVRAARPAALEAIARQAAAEAEPPHARTGRSIAVASVRESGAAHGPSTELQRLARRHRSDGLGRCVAAAWQYAIRKAGQAVVAWKYQRDARAIYRALRELHPRTLRDLGIDRRELRSVAAEAASTAAATRLRLDRALRGLY